jgi:superfamily II DNA/RNA helicase
MGCRHIDSFVHRSGRTGRVGKKGLNIIFFERDETKFILNLEDELNIKFDLSSSLSTQDPAVVKERVIEDFKKKALKKRTHDNN